MTQKPVSKGTRVGLWDQIIMTKEEGLFKYINRQVHIDMDICNHVLQMFIYNAVN